MKVKLRKPFNIIDNPYIWAALIDSTDLLGWIPIGGEVLDVVQFVAALTIFEHPGQILVGAADVVLPGPLDLMPTYVAAVYISER